MPASILRCMNKRGLEELSWRLSRGRRHDMTLLARLVNDLRRQAVDHVAVTGDAINVGWPYEFARATDWLGKLGDPAAVSFVPGNHDALTSANLPLLAAFEPWMRSDSGKSGFPFLRRRGDIALIGLSSATPTAPFSAAGELGGVQLVELSGLLDFASDERLFRLVMVHHPPVPKRGGRLRNLRDADAFRRLIARHGAELIVHGHDHSASETWIAGPRGPVPVVGAPCISAAAHSGWSPAGYRLFRISRAGAGWAIEMRTRYHEPDADEIREHVLSSLGRRNG